MIVPVVVLSIAAVIILVVVSTKWTLSKSRGILDQWAEAEGYELLTSEYR